MMHPIYLLAAVLFAVNASAVALTTAFTTPVNQLSSFSALSNARLVPPIMKNLMPQQMNARRSTVRNMWNPLFFGGVGPLDENGLFTGKPASDIPVKRMSNILAERETPGQGIICITTEDANGVIVMKLNCKDVKDPLILDMFQEAFKKLSEHGFTDVAFIVEVNAPDYDDQAALLTSIGFENRKGDFRRVSLTTSSYEPVHFWFKKLPSFKTYGDEPWELPPNFSFHVQVLNFV